MRIRSLVLSLLVAAAWCLAPSAHADTTGSGGSGTGGTSAGTGGSAGDPNCTVSTQEQSGTKCVVCDTSIGLCSDQLGSAYGYICKSSASAEIWCDGPARAQSSDSAPSCSVKVPGAHGDVTAVCVLAAAALAAGLRRRKD